MKMALLTRCSVENFCLKRNLSMRDYGDVYMPYISVYASVYVQTVNL